MAEEDKIEKKDYAEIYAHPSWRYEAAYFEDQFSRKLYDQEPVRSAGGTALSRISRLLVRYNKLKRTEKYSADTTRAETMSIEQNYGNSVGRIREEIEEISKKLSDTQISEEDKKKYEARKKKLDDDIQELEKNRNIQLDNIRKNIEANERETLEKGIDRKDDGRVLSSLMLGGDAEGGRGYNLSGADYKDLANGGDYIAEVSSDKGTLMDQMSLFDNAVNSEGVNVGGGEIYGFQDIVSGAKEGDIERMNGGMGPDVKLDLSLQGKEGFKNFGGTASKRKEVDEVFAQRETDEAKLRRNGKKGDGKKVKATKEQKAYLRGVNMSANSFMGGFFGGFGSLVARRKSAVTSGKKLKMPPNSQRAKRDIVQKEADRFFTDLAIRNRMPITGGIGALSAMQLREKRDEEQQKLKETMKKEKPGAVNKNDTSEKLPSQDLFTMTKLEETGFITTAPDGSKQPASAEGKDAIKEGGADPAKAAQALNQRSAGNMLRAFRIMGAEPKEIAMFRLALIAYMVPSGKKTVYEVLSETKLDGEENDLDKVNLTEPGLMYQTLVSSTKEMLGKDITLAKKEEPKVVKQKGENGKVSEMVELQEIGDKVELKLPTDQVKEHIAREKAEKERAFQADVVTGFKTKKVDLALNEGEHETVELNPGGNDGDGKKEDKKDDPVKKAQIRVFETAFPRFGAIEDDLTGTEEKTELAGIISKHLTEKSNGDQLKKVIGAIIPHIETEKGNQEKFWKKFIGMFMDTFVTDSLNALDKLDKETFKNKIPLIKAELTEQKSAFKDLILKIYKEAGKANEA